MQDNDLYIRLKVRLLKQMYPMLRWVDVRNVASARIALGTIEFIESYRHHWAATDEEGKRSGSFVATGIDSWFLPAFHTFKYWPERGKRNSKEFPSLASMLQETSKAPRYIVHFEYDDSHKLHITVYDYSDFNWSEFHRGVYTKVVSELLSELDDSLERARAHLMLAARTHSPTCEIEDESS